MLRKIWERFDYVVDAQTGESIAFELKRLTWDEAEPLRVHVAKALNIAASFHDLEAASLNAALPKAISDIFESLPVEIVRTAFEKWVRNVSGLEVEDDAGVHAVTTGAELFQTVADQGLVMFILGSLDRLSRMSAKLGKGSGSSSTSPSTPAGSDTSSAATSTGGADGPSPSTATAPAVPDTGSGAGTTSPNPSHAVDVTETSTGPGQ